MEPGRENFVEDMKKWEAKFREEGREEMRRELEDQHKEELERANLAKKGMEKILQKEMDKLQEKLMARDEELLEQNAILEETRGEVNKYKEKIQKMDGDLEEIINALEGDAEDLLDVEGDDLDLFQRKLEHLFELCFGIVEKCDEMNKFQERMTRVKLNLETALQRNDLDNIQITNVVSVGLGLENETSDELEVGADLEPGSGPARTPARASLRLKLKRLQRQIASESMDLAGDRLPEGGSEEAEEQQLNLELSN